MPIRAHGEGSILQRKDGRWQASLQVGGIRKIVYGKTRSEAVQKLKALQETARKNQRLPNAGKVTLSDYLTNWLKQAASHLRPSTKERYIYDAAKIASLGQIPLAKLTPFKLAQFFAELDKTSKRTSLGVYRMLHKALADAERWGLIASNPLAVVDVPKYRPREKRLWEPEQIQMFLRAMLEGKGGTYSSLFVFLLASGCRLGEALGLRWSDIDWHKDTIRIERQVVQVDNKAIEDAPKTRSGVRTITLPAFGLEALKMQKAKAASMRVFVSEVGTTPLRSNLRRSLVGVCKKLGLPVIMIHSLRHLHLSLLAMNGVPVKVAQARAGHSSPTVTMQVYTHVLGDGDKLAAQAMESVLKADNVVD
ncbi:MAG: site-specific integrase [Chloroflexi bacterium]|nr:site-specific integrase [Chloroflexota bacterium]